VDARYVTVSMTTFATGYGGSLWEFEVYGPSVSVNVDKLALAATIDTVALLDLTGYTADSASALSTALAATAAAVADDAAVTQAEVDAALAAIREAISNLELQPAPPVAAPISKESLTALLEVAGALSMSEYTATSFVVVAIQMTRAAIIAGDVDATQAEIDSATTALSAAISALVPTPKTPFKKSPTPKISGTAAVGKKLTAKPGTWSPKPTYFSYQWFRGDLKIDGATQATYTPTPADLGTKVSVKVRGQLTDYSEAWSHPATAKKIAAGKLTAKTPTVTNVTSGKAPNKTAPAIGDQLRADPGAWGPTGVQTVFKWYRSGKVIKDATDASYTLVAADKGKTITVKVTGSLTGYKTVTKTSKATKKVSAG
jgi:hypothetical protein